MKSGAHKKKIVFTAAGFCVAILAAVAFWPGVKEPEYRGRKLSEWIDIAMQARTVQGSAAQAREAVSKIGQKGVPFFVKWVGADRRLQLRMGMVRKLPLWAQKTSLVKVWLAPVKSIKQAERGRTGFEIVGTNGASAIADLRKIAEHADPGVNANRACACLSYTGQGGLTALLEIFRSTRAIPNRQWAVVTALRNVAYLGSNAAPAIPVLTGSVNSTNASLSATAMDALNMWAMDPDHVFRAAYLRQARCFSFDPRLRALVVTSLEDINGRFVDSAHDAAMNACEDSDEAVRIAATNALDKILVKISSQRKASPPRDPPPKPRRREEFIYWMGTQVPKAALGPKPMRPSLTQG